MTLSFDVVIEQPVIGVEVVENPVGVIVVNGPQGPKGDPGPGVDVWAEEIAGDGVQTVFVLSHFTLSPFSVQVFRNGLAELTGIGFTVSNDGNSTTVTFSSAPLEDDEVQVVYHV
mgnify:CR=1 FL=1